jgi:hypothetical protein
MTYRDWVGTRLPTTQRPVFLDWRGLDADIAQLSDVALPAFDHTKASLTIQSVAEVPSLRSN